MQVVMGHLVFQVESGTGKYTPTPTASGENSSFGVTSIPHATKEIII